MSQPKGVNVKKVNIMRGGRELDLLLKLLQQFKEFGLGGKRELLDPSPFSD